MRVIKISYYINFIFFYEFLVIDGNEIVYRDYVDISVAVAAPKVFININK